MRNLLIKIFLPLIKAITYLGKPEPKCSYFDYKAIKLLSRPGDCLVCREDFRLSNLLIKGFWSHIAIVVGDDHVLEAVPPRVRLVHLSQFVMSKDHVSLLRPKWRFKYENITSDYEGDLYDFSFIKSNELWYCAELVNDYYDRISENNPIVSKKVWGVETIIPDDFYDSKHLNNIYEKRN